MEKNKTYGWKPHTPGWVDDPGGEREEGSGERRDFPKETGIRESAAGSGGKIFADPG